MSDVRENAKRNICYYLMANDVSQKELANAVGVSPSAVNKWVTGQNSPDIEMLAKICEYFQVPFSEILGNNGEEPLTDLDRLVIRQYKKKKDVQHVVNVLLGIYEYIDIEK